MLSPEGSGEEGNVVSQHFVPFCCIFVYVSVHTVYCMYVRTFCSIMVLIRDDWSGCGMSPW